MNTLGWVHVSLSLGAMAMGARILLMDKGTPRHRQMGQVYVFAMLGLNLSALMIYRLFGYFGPFHWAALFSLVTVLAGFIAARRARPRGGWLYLHAHMMLWSYVGLLAAAVSEITTRLLQYPFGLTVALSSALVFVLGGLAINRGVPKAISGMRKARPFIQRD